MLRYNMLAPGDSVVAAVSGGRDSVCLLSVLCELAGRFKATVAGVAHLNHKLRGEASDADERFVAALAARHGLPFYRHEADIAGVAGAGAAKPGPAANLEQTARRERLKFFSRLIAEGKANRIATGHTKDDQAETVLFRLLRGSGLAGLAGILPVTEEGLIRPLLEVGRAEVEEFLRVRGILWREDASNQDRRFARNRIRHDLLPQLAREWNPEVAGALANLADLAYEEERWWRGEIAALAEKLMVVTERKGCGPPLQIDPVTDRAALRFARGSQEDGEIEIQAEALAGLDRAVARRLVRKAVSMAGGRAEFGHVEKVLDLAKDARGSGCLELPGLLVERSFDWLRFTTAGGLGPLEPVPVEVPGRYRWLDGEVCFEVAEKLERPGCVSLKWNGWQLPAHLELRGWRAGDHYRPWGRSRDQKIQEMFQKARIPSWKRGVWPILTNGSKILWVRGFGAAAELTSEGHPGPSLHIWEEKSGGA
ncbi:MAG TPA: tRNA lysidine(34) synthetase TilS [Bryobacteraceae bacterium]|jgi:tRNA(Ile)-lysidine synthase